MTLSANFKNSLLVIVALLGVGLMVLFFYEKSVEEKMDQEEQASFSEENSDQQLSLPEPTGKTEVIWESALAGIEAEVESESDEDALAQEVINDDDEVSAFSSAYENSEF